MAFEKCSTEQLTKYKKILLISSIVALVIMCFALGFGVYQSSKYDNNTLVFLVPTVFGPLAMIPSLFSAGIEKEMKKRQKENG
ncbi:hypothetical protein [Maribacter sp. 2308TA10-17]|uniref:hypothetical protein n=1 Tax=Maribacter sp. 2308TA10-17 TaxID=3386276 RepID=UPI0039BD6209